MSYKYYKALEKHGERLKLLYFKAVNKGYPVFEKDYLLNFIDKFLIETREKDMPLNKLNRWFSHIQTILIISGVTSVEEERNITRPDFRVLDYEK